MAKKSKLRKKEAGDDAFLRLVQEFPLRPIRTDAQHDTALDMFTRFAGREESIDVATIDYLDVLARLIRDYEKAAGHSLDTSHVTAGDVVRHLLAERAMSVNALAKELDIQQGDLTKMLNRKRDWSKSVIIKLSDYFGLQSELFLKRA